MVVSQNSSVWSFGESPCGTGRIHLPLRLGLTTARGELSTTTQQRTVPQENATTPSSHGGLAFGMQVPPSSHYIIPEKQPCVCKDDLGSSHLLFQTWY